MLEIGSTVAVQRFDRLRLTSTVWALSPAFKGEWQIWKTSLIKEGWKIFMKTEQLNL